MYVGVNSCGIGVELANAGDDEQLGAHWSGLPLIRARHRNGGHECWWEQFPAVQLAACATLARTLVERYRLDDVTGHDCIAPERKVDPGPVFPMEGLREECGFSGLPKVFWP